MATHEFTVREQSPGRTKLWYVIQIVTLPSGVVEEHTMATCPERGTAQLVAILLRNHHASTKSL